MGSVLKTAATVWGEKNPTQTEGRLFWRQSSVWACFRRSLVLCLVWEHCTLSAYVSTFSFLDSFLFPLCLCVFIASSSGWKHQARFCTQTGPVIAGNCVCLVSWLWEIPLFPLSLSCTSLPPELFSQPMVESCTGQRMLHSRGITLNFLSSTGSRKLLVSFLQLNKNSLAPTMHNYEKGFKPIKKTRRYVA